jgi:hypothetical protein
LSRQRLAALSLKPPMEGMKNLRESVGENRHKR